MNEPKMLEQDKKARQKVKQIKTSKNKKDGKISINASDLKKMANDRLLKRAEL
jgi:hypothetical protein